jgi:hypothetical protein
MSNAPTPDESRVITAALIAPALVGAATGLIVVAWMSLLEGSLRGFVAMAVYAVPIGAITGGVTGWPVTALLGPAADRYMRKRRWTGAGHYLLAGAVLGVIPVLVVMMFTASAIIGRLDGAPGVLGMAAISLVFLLASGVGGLVFWMIRRPDRSTQSGKTA